MCIAKNVMALAWLSGSIRTAKVIHIHKILTVRYATVLESLINQS